MTLRDCQSHRQSRATDDSADRSNYSPDLLFDAEDGHQPDLMTLGSGQAITAKLYGIPVPPAIFRTKQGANCEIMKQLSNTPLRNKPRFENIPLVFIGLFEVVSGD